MKYKPKFKPSEWKETLEIMSHPGDIPEDGHCGVVMTDVQEFIKWNCVQSPMQYYKQSDDINRFKDHMKDTQWGYEFDDEYLGFSGPEEEDLKEYSMLCAEYFDESYAPIY